MKTILFIFILCLIFSCSREDIPKYDSTNYIQFAENYKDSLDISFFFYPGKTSLEIPLTVKLLGQLLDVEKDYSIVAIANMTTAESSLYDIPQNLKFKKDEVYDTVLLKINHPGEKEVKLTLEIKGDDGILQGQTEYIYKIIQFSNKVVKPEWWDADVVDFYLGTYSEKKFRLLMEITQIGDWTDLNPDQRLAQARKLKYYLREMEALGTPIIDENGTNMTVTVIG